MEAGELIKYTEWLWDQWEFWVAIVLLSLR
jgi:hypothetical protein